MAKVNSVINIGISDELRWFIATRMTFCSAFGCKYLDRRDEICTLKDIEINTEGRCSMYEGLKAKCTTDTGEHNE